MVISEADKDELLKRLTEKGANPITKGCLMCGGKWFTLVDGYITNFAQKAPLDTAIGGPRVASVAFVCDKCGFMTQHSLASLGLLPKPS